MKDPEPDFAPKGYYYWDTYPESRYEVLIDPDGREICCITEPEDRSFRRDLNSVIVELNRLRELIDDAS